MNMEKKYQAYSSEWEKAVKKLPKDELIKMIRKLKTGTEDVKIAKIKTSWDAEKMCQGFLNDFESGTSTKEETMRGFMEYTYRLMSLFNDALDAKLKEI
jgi:hypothetical protein